MEAERWQRIKTIAHKALTLTDTERQNYITNICGNDHELRNEILQLLKSIRESGEENFLAELEISEDTISELYNQFQKISSRNEMIGKKIGHYQITDLVGKGGMGSVFKAERSDSQFHQEVAVKMIRKEVESEDNIKRFRIEQEILARLHHPNICRLYDGGITQEGTPYLVMEFIDGIPVDEYCNKYRLTTDERIELFRTICSAVQYAHGNLIVHRDLKAQNIYVNQDGIVKILDFGVAKLLDPAFTDIDLLETRTGQKFWTPQYAAPEQIKNETITVTTDVYALGVLLHKLLTDTYPLDVSGMEISAIERTILEGVPILPSQSIKNGPHQKIAKRRKTSPSGLRKKLYGDLDAVVLKAIRKEPNYRYNSVEQLLEDIDRYQKRLPLIARKGTIRYRVTKFTKRHKTVLTTIIIILAAVGSFGIYHIYQIEKQRDIAQQEAKKATRIKEFTTTLFNAINPYYEENIGRTVTVNQLLEAGILNIETELVDEPEIYTEMQTVIGKALIGLGEYEQAKELINKSLEKTIALYGEDHPAVAENMTLIARLDRIQGEYESALVWMNNALLINETVHGKESLEVANGYYEMGLIYSNSMNYENAAKYLIQALQLYEKLDAKNDLSAINTLISLAGMQNRQELYDEAEINLLSAEEKLRERYGDNHLQLANVYNSLALYYSDRSNLAKSEEYYQKGISLKQRLLGENHPQHIRTFSSYGLLLYRMGKYEESEKMQTDALQLFERNALTDSLDYVAITNRLALVKAATGQLTQAVDLYNEALTIMDNYLESDHSEITVVLYNLADLYYRMNELEQAHTLFEEVVERDKKVLGDDHSEIAIDLVKLAAVTRDQYNFVQAEQLFSEAESIITDKFKPDHYRTGEFYMEYGRLKMMNMETEGAIDLFEKSLSIFQENYDESHEKVVQVKEYLTQIKL